MCKVRVRGSLFNYTTRFVVCSLILHKSNRKWPGKGEAEPETAENMHTKITEISIKGRLSLLKIWKHIAAKIKIENCGLRPQF
jgi:hypothetical protein